MQAAFAVSKNLITILLPENIDLPFKNG